MSNGRDSERGPLDSFNPPTPKEPDWEKHPLAEQPRRRKFRSRLVLVIALLLLLGFAIQPARTWLGKRKQADQMAKATAEASQQAQTVASTPAHAGPVAPQAPVTTAPAVPKPTAPAKPDEVALAQAQDKQLPSTTRQPDGKIMDNEELSNNIRNIHSRLGPNEGQDAIVKADVAAIKKDLARVTTVRNSPGSQTKVREEYTLPNGKFAPPHVTKPKPWNWQPPKKSGGS